MPLQHVPLPPVSGVLSREVRLFLEEADRRIRHFQHTCRCPAFVASDYVRVQGVLEGIEASGLAQGRSFCEWGSGFGVVAGLAALLGFDACGIEAAGELVTEARRLAHAYDLPVAFAHGSFLPAEASAHAEDFGWLETDMKSGYSELGLDADDFDLVYAFPWPDEEDLVARVFADYGRPGALLLTYHDSQEMRLRRRVAGRRK